MRLPIRWHRDKNMLTIGGRIWMFSRVRLSDDDYCDLEDVRSYRVIVFHAYRLHLTLEWERR